MNAIETTGLAYQFRKDESVLRDINLQVPTGSIYGFLGPNGAGKTTTLRLILGLLRQQKGEIQVLGRPLPANRVDLLRRIGSSIESPSLYAHLTAAENLEVWRLIFQCDRGRIQECLRLVGLADTGGKKAGQFSLGMKQRLGIAIALLHEPSVLILDEPTNGLDPHGMIEMRDLLLRLNREKGITMVVSSHLLSEIERLVSHVGIIHRGALVYQGTLASLAARQQQTAFIRIDSNDNERAMQLMASGGYRPRSAEGKLVIGALLPFEVAAINQALVAAGIAVHELSRHERNLEGIFMDLVRN